MKINAFAITINICGLFVFQHCDNSTEPKNRPPVIVNIFGNPLNVHISESSIITCDANDPDGDHLTYVWETTMGSISGMGDTVTWIAPNSVGTYFVLCKVMDGNGGQDVDSVGIQVENSIPTQGLIAYYPFNGNALDETGNGNDGNVHGATLSNDRFNTPQKAYRFDGDDYIYVNHSAYFDEIENYDSISLSVWIKVIDWYYYFPDNPIFPILDKYESSIDFGWEFLIWSKHFQFYPSQDNTIVCYFDFGLNIWYHIVCVYKRNPGKFLVYVDNQLICTKTLTTDIFDTSGEPLYIGYSKTGQDEFAIGLIDDIRIYNRDLSSAEVATLYTESGWGN
ncbi:MAG: hypothetical protein GF353_24945 [Candidatus Lokiarchaeota archaeon]|nr:hypothetical protein [Candidatus Lokiarchaeota archaeon]